MAPTTTCKPSRGSASNSSRALRTQTGEKMTKQPVSAPSRILRQPNSAEGSLKIPGRVDTNTSLPFQPHSPLSGTTFTAKSGDPVDSRLSQLADPANELLAYYRRKVQSLTDDHEAVQRRLDQIGDAIGNQERLTWELHQREAEIGELQKALSDMQVYLFQERDHVLRLYAENDRLKIRELDDRRKIQHLLQMSGLGAAEVTYFFRESGAFPQGAPTVEPNAAYSKEGNGQADSSEDNPHSGNISGLVVTPIIPITPAEGTVELTASGKTIKRPPVNGLGSAVGADQQGRSDTSVRSTVSRSQYEAALREIEMTKAALHSLRTQLAEQTRAAQEQIDTLLDDRRVMQEEMDTVRKRHTEQMRSFTEKLKRCQELLYDSTKEFLAQRNQFRQAEKVWITEKDKLLSQVEAKKAALAAVPSVANRHNTSQSGRDRSLGGHSTDLESRAWTEIATQLAEKKQDQLLQTLNNLENQLEQQQKLSDMYREQVIQLEEELVRNREEGIMSKDVFKEHTNKLNERLQTMSNRYRDLERRRQLEMEGYHTDINTLRKKLREVEKQLLKLTLGMTDGADGPHRPKDVDIAILNHVKASAMKSNQLMGELKNLKLKMYTLEDELRKL
ncbi:unnamed protein product [Calicophoron daubneyi]|uniref:Coiled-coil domain-containing protein 77 n=1 Tax=Calicophoron daubneyi TaxID=300641 RepID=A0AAV2TBH3_CALDB